MHLSVRSASDAQPVVRAVSITALSMAAGMLAFETFKQSLFPDITIWTSHAITILFTTGIATILAVIVARQSAGVQRRLAATIEAQRTSDERFQQLAANVREAFWIVALEPWEVVYISPAYESIWGRPCASLYEKPSLWFDAIHPADRERMEETVARRAVPAPFEGEFRIVRPNDDVRWIRAHGFPILEAGRATRMAGIAADITEEKLARTRLGDAQKMEALGTLARGIAHDFNNILQIFSSYTEGAALRCSDRPDELRALGILLSAVERAHGIVRQILTFSRQSFTPLEPLAIREAVDDALGILRASLLAHIDIEYEFDPDTPRILANRSQVQQVVLNLVTNAAHAIGDTPGCITVRVDQMATSEQFRETHHGAHAERYARVVVTDTGQGMDASVQARMFEPFFSTKQVGQGTGLGLAVVHGIVESYGGAIDVDSAPGRGTTVTIFFPATAAVSSGGIALSASTGSDHAARRILLVDDERDIVELWSDLLASSGHSVLTMTDPYEALARFEQQPEEFDLVVTDLSMPGMSGREVARAVRRARADIPVILMSGLGMHLSPMELAECGVSAVLSKPVTTDQFARAINLAFADAGAKSARDS